MEPMNVDPQAFDRDAVVVTRQRFRDLLIYTGTHDGNLQRNEDRVLPLNNFSGSLQLLGARGIVLCDGHVSDQASEYATQNFSSVISNSLLDIDFSVVLDNETRTLITRRIEEAIHNLDQRIRLRIFRMDPGTTLAAAILIEKHLITISLGDSSVMIAQRTLVPVQNPLHNTDLITERERVNRAVEQTQIAFKWVRAYGRGVEVGFRNDRNGQSRSLDMTRTLGCHFFKRIFPLADPDQPILNIPEITVRARALAADEFIVVASDGVTDFVNLARVATIIRRRNSRRAADIVKDILELAFHEAVVHENIQDNMSIGIIFLRGYLINDLTFLELDNPLPDPNRVVQIL